MADQDTAADRIVVISADTHGGAELREYKEYLPARWHEEFDAWAEGYESPWDDLVNDTKFKNWDSELRLKHLDADGIAAEVLIPNTIPPFFPTIQNIVSLPTERDDYERRMAGLRAHNRWAEAFCKKVPGRRRALFQIFPNDVDDAIAEVEWAVGTGVAAGVLMPGIPPNHPAGALYASRMDPLWERCAALGIPVCQHEGTGIPDYPDHPASAGISSYEQSYFAQRSLWTLILGGVFERHPDLRYVFTEQGVNWIPQALNRLDATITGAKKRPWADMFFRGAYEALSMTAWEYWKRNCYVGHPLRPVEIEDCFELGVDHIMWGSDYPHTDATSPYSREAIRLSLAGVDETNIRKLLGGNAAGLFGFDLEALAPVAARIGPSLEEVRTPLAREDYPDAEWFEIRAGVRSTILG
ncbi:amidohydrolase family protein [Pseudonocardia ailaonensis]|uniref:Amidohydrolase family protein n=1 Tax=Pseudonocardia ailaonensis TaxID=367279 RepID=A0ABN2N3Y4_9PSEU